MTHTLPSTPPHPAPHAAPHHAPHPAKAPRSDLGPAQLGVGARFSLHPLSGDAVPLILRALASGDATRLDIVTDDVSTFVRGEEPDVLTYLRDVIATAGATGVHTVAHVLLSRGCPGEVDCDLPDDAVLRPVPLPVLEPTGLAASAHWALYPLDDGLAGPGGTRRDHLAVIEAAVDRARARGTWSRAEHFVTRLDGDLADVLTTVAEGWLLAGRTVRHVTTHVTISLHSPSAGGATGVGGGAR